MTAGSESCTQEGEKNRGRKKEITVRQEVK
jgi:hypothetical protein